MGIVPKGTQLAPKPEAIKDWENLSEVEKALFTRQVETFAAFLDYTDHHVGRFIDAIGEPGQLDNTLVVYIAGDNGTSAEGGMNGMVLAQGGRFGGWALYVKDCIPAYDYNFLGLQRTSITGHIPKVTIEVRQLERIEFPQTKGSRLYASGRNPMRSVGLLPGYFVSRLL